MKRMQSLMAGVLGAGVVAGGAGAQQAVQWRVEDGGNGHWYQGVKLSTSTHVGWEASRAFAIARGADLACLNTTAELNWVYAQVASSPMLWSWSSGPWIGAYQAQGAREPGSQWFWIDGSTLQSDFPWTFTQPDNATYCGGNEAYAFYWYGEGPPSPANRFADLVQSGYCIIRAAGDWVTSAVLEWSSDCNNDGIVDYGQVLSGELADLEGDNVPDCCQLGVACDCRADVDRNRFVDGVDLAIILSKWGTSGGKDYPAADIDRSGSVDASDLAEVLNSWGPCP